MSIEAQLEELRLQLLHDRLDLLDEDELNDHDE